MYTLCKGTGRVLLTLALRYFVFKPHSARTGRTVFSQLSAAVVRHKPNDGLMQSERGLSTTLSGVV